MWTFVKQCLNQCNRYQLLQFTNKHSNISVGDMWTVWGHSGIKLTTETKLEVFTAFVWDALWLHLLLVFSLNESRRTCCCTAVRCVVIVYVLVFDVTLVLVRLLSFSVPEDSHLRHRRRLQYLLVSNCFVEKQHLNNFSSNLVSLSFGSDPSYCEPVFVCLLLLALAPLLMCVCAPRARSLQCVHACLPSFSVVCPCLHGWIQIGLSSLWLQMLYEYDFTPPPPHTLSVFLTQTLLCSWLAFGVTRVPWHTLGVIRFFRCYE